MPATLIDLLGDSRDRIIARFVSEVQRHDLPPQKLERSLLVDHIPRFLDEVAEKLASAIHPAAGLPQGRENPGARSHAEQRWGLGYDLESVILEYELLRQAIFACASERGVAIDLAEIDVLARHLSLGVAAATEEFVRQRNVEGDARRRDRDFLLEADELLTSSLDYQSTLTRLIRLCVPRLADWCAIYIEGTDPDDLTVAHASATKLPLLRELVGRFPLSRDAPHGFHAVARSGEPQRVEHAPPELHERIAQNPEHLRLLRELGSHSWLIVPLRAQERLLGALTLVWSDSPKQYSDADLDLAMQLARRSSVAIDNARLYELSQRERAKVEAATRAKDEFVAVVSHELRTPLNAILGWTRLLRGQGLPEEKRELALDVIERNAVAQSHLVSDLLDVSRVSTGRIRIHPVQVDLCTLVELVLGESRLAIEAKRLRVSVDLDHTDCVLRGDAERLRQVVWNVITNAIKFTPKGGAVHVALRRVDSDLELVVRDSGAGMRQGVMALIFEPFRQADTSLSRAHGGLGVGLSIAKHLIDLHGGTITAASEGEGRGSTFTIRFPVSALASANVGVGRFPVTTAERYRWPSGLEGLRALVVDDDVDARDLVATVLEHCGISAVKVGDVTDAMESLKDSRPDVVISDIGLQGEDGYAFVTRVRALESDLAKTPLIALTALATREARERALIAGFNVHLAKPVAAAELLGAIADATGRVAAKPRG